MGPGTVKREPMGSEGRWRLLGKSRVLALTLYYSSSFVKIFFFFLDVGHFIFLSLPNLLQYCLFYFLGFLAPRHMDLSSLTRDQIRTLGR